MPISKLRRRSQTESRPTVGTGDWKPFQFFGDFLQYASDAGASRAVLTDSTRVITAAETLTAVQSGATFFLDLVGGFTVTLPAVAAGLRFTFIVKTAPTTAYIITGAAADLIVGSAHSSTGGNADSETTVGATEVTFVASTAVVGDRIDIVCDGTYWYAQGFSDADAGITFTN